MPNLDLTSALDVRFGNQQALAIRAGGYDIWPVGTPPVQHSVFNPASAYPNTLESYMDGQPVAVLTTFYPVSTSGLKLKGVKLFVPDNAWMMNMTLTFLAWRNPVTALQAGGSTPDRTKVSSAMVAGWNTVMFDTSLDIDPASSGHKFGVGYYSPTGDYIAVPGSTGTGFESAVAAYDGFDLHMAEISDFGGVPRGRYQYNYPTGSGGPFAVYSGLDVIVE